MVTRLLLSAAVAIFAVAAWSSGFDRLTARNGGFERLVPNPFGARASLARSEQLILREDDDGAMAEARSAVAADPVDPDATAMLGAVYLASERWEDADAAFRVAARFGWRNLSTQSYWYQAALGVDDYARAADRLDAILRAHPRLADSKDLIGPMEANAAGRAELARHLSAKPDWAQIYLFVPLDVSRSLLERRFQVLNDASMQRTSLGCEVVRRFTNLLMTNGMRDQAVEIWNRNCPAQKASGPVSDLKFCHVLADPVTKTPLTWQPILSGNVSFASAASEANNCGIAIENQSSSEQLALYQTVALPPGRYRIKIAGTANGTDPRGTSNVSWKCEDSVLPARRPEGDPAASGQTIQVDACERQRLAISVMPHRKVELGSISIQRAQ